MPSLEKVPPPDALELARKDVLAALPLTTPSIQAPALQAAAPLRPLPAALEAKLANRYAYGLDPLGTEHPRGRVWQRTVLPAGVFAVLDALAALIAYLTDHPVLAIIALILLVPLAALCAGGARFGLADPLRLNTTERREITSSTTWQSANLWPGDLSSSAQRALVVTATAAVGRIAASPAWRAGGLSEHRGRLDLAVELTEIDEQAFRIATAGEDPSTAAAWDALVTRVAALSCYADGLDRLMDLSLTKRPEPDPAALMAGTARDELAVEELGSLTYFLNPAAPEVR